MFRQNKNDQSYYDILKVKPDSSDEEVRRSYLDLAKIYHPDSNPNKRNLANMRFRLINEAYDALKTQNGRTRYSNFLSARKANNGGTRLRADNDNKNVDVVDRSFWSQLSSFFLPTKSFEPNTFKSRKER